MLKFRLPQEVKPNQYQATMTVTTRAHVKQYVNALTRNFFTLEYAYLDGLPYAIGTEDILWYLLNHLRPAAMEDSPVPLTRMLDDLICKAANENKWIPDGRDTYCGESVQHKGRSYEKALTMLANYVQQLCSLGLVYMQDRRTNSSKHRTTYVWYNPVLDVNTNEDWLNESNQAFWDSHTIPKVISVDYDYTLTNENCYPDTGALNLDFVHWLSSLQSYGITIILNTCRERPEVLDPVVTQLKEHGLSPNYINDNTDAAVQIFKHNSRKISADISFDDTSFSWDADDALMFVRTLNRLCREMEFFKCYQEMQRKKLTTELEQPQPERLHE